METRRVTIAEMHTDTRILYNVMESKFIKNKQAEISYEELSSSIGRNVQMNARGLLSTARKRIEKDFQIVIEPVMNEGLRGTTDYAGIGGKTNAHLHRHSQKHRKRILNAITGKELSPEQILPLAVELSKLGATALFTRRQTPKQLTAYIQEHNILELPTQQTLKLFQNGKNTT